VSTRYLDRFSCDPRYQLRVPPIRNCHNNKVSLVHLCFPFLLNEFEGVPSLLLCCLIETDNDIDSNWYLGCKSVCWERSFGNNQLEKLHFAHIGWRATRNISFLHQGYSKRREYLLDQYSQPINLMSIWSCSLSEEQPSYNCFKVNLVRSYWCWCQIFLARLHHRPASLLNNYRVWIDLQNRVYLHLSFIYLLLSNLHGNWFGCHIRAHRNVHYTCAHDI
jgi:hypothetical protein